MVSIKVKTIPTKQSTMNLPLATIPSYCPLQSQVLNSFLRRHSSQKMMEISRDEQGTDEGNEDKAMRETKKGPRVSPRLGALRKNHKSGQSYDTLYMELEARGDPWTPDMILKYCPMLSKAELCLLSHAIDTFLVSIQAEEEALQEAARQQSEDNKAGSLSMYISCFHDNELKSTLPLRPPILHPMLDE